MKMDDKDEMMMGEPIGGKEGKHIMTMDDVAHELSEDFGDEIHDAKKYLCMAKVADGAGAYEDSHALLEMAKDEYTHAEFIHDFMVSHNMHIDEEHWMHYEKLSEEMAKFF